MDLSSFSPGDNTKHKNKYGNAQFDVELERVNLKLLPPY